MATFASQVLERLIDFGDKLAEQFGLREGLSAEEFRQSLSTPVTMTLPGGDVRPLKRTCFIDLFLSTCNALSNQAMGRTSK